MAETTDIFDPLVIYPEGGTTNGKSIIQFKKGAFVSCRSIWPKIHKWHSHFQSPCTGVVDGVAHYLIGAAMPWCTVTKLEMPVFRPNDFFWANHQQPGEERWETYARVLRKLMSEVGDLPLSEEKIEQKFEYKRILYPSKTDEKKKQN